MTKFPRNQVPQFPSFSSHGFVKSIHVATNKGVSFFLSLIFFFFLQSLSLLSYKAQCLQRVNILPSKSRLTTHRE